MSKGCRGLEKLPVTQGVGTSPPQWRTWFRTKVYMIKRPGGVLGGYRGSMCAHVYVAVSIYYPSITFTNHPPG